MSATEVDTRPRECDWCGAPIDPVDWCGACQHSAAQDPPRACSTHRRLRKRSDARYCDAECRAADRNDLARIRRAER